MDSVEKLQILHDLKEAAQTAYREIRTDSQVDANDSERMMAEMLYQIGGLLHEINQRFNGGCFDKSYIAEKCGKIVDLSKSVV